MKVTKSNKELLLLLQKDDRVAFYNIYERYSKRLYCFVLQYVKLDADAEERGPDWVKDNELQIQEKSILKGVNFPDND